MFLIKYKGLRLIPSKTASRELMKYGFGVEDCKAILENGYSPRKRKQGIEEKWLDKGDKTYNVVIVKDYDEIMREDVWVLIHFGKFSKRRR